MTPSKNTAPVTVVDATGSAHSANGRYTTPISAEAPRGLPAVVLEHSERTRSLIDAHNDLVADGKDPEGVRAIATAHLALELYKTYGQSAQNALRDGSEVTAAGYAFTVPYLQRTVEKLIKVEHGDHDALEGALQDGVRGMRSATSIFDGFGSTDTIVQIRENAVTVLEDLTAYLKATRP